MDITRILVAIDQGEPGANDALFAAVYQELRGMAAQRMRDEASDHTLQSTALVHEAFLRLVPAGDQHWESRGHFFTAAAEAMRRILIDHGRRKQAVKRGGDMQRLDLQEQDAVSGMPVEQLLMINEGLDALERDDPESARIAKLRLFVGLSIDEAAHECGLARATAYRQWAYARARLRAHVSGGSRSDEID